jgi:hypothetical protein
MRPSSFLRRILIGLLGTVLSGTLLAATARPDELGASLATGGFAIHGAQETLRDFCRADAEGRMWLELPGGARYELVTSASDPAISNPGDGSFHPFEEPEVRAALAAVRFPLAKIRADVFILPYPRRAGFESAAGRGVILLSPGMLAMVPEHQHAEFLHELGHVIQYQLMPDGDADAWSAYRRMRGIEDAGVFAATAPHADRPHEIFAEDFRALFGDPLATYSGSIENPRLPLPGQVAGLGQFMLSLLADRPVSSAVAASPNPARGAVVFTRSGASAAPLDLFDVSGRRIRSLTPAAGRGMATWSWDGLTDDGRRMGPGVVFARARDAGGTTRVTLLP